MPSVDSTLLTAGWDNHGEIDQEDRQALLNLLPEGSTQESGKPAPET